LPMAKFLTTRGATSEIEKIINNANKSIVLISPYIKIPGSLFQNLLTADKRGIKTTLIFGKSKLDPDVQNQLKNLQNVAMYFLNNLHAKCYFNESQMVITSLNLYDYSEQNNREMGILISRQEDKEAFSEAVREAQIIMNLAEQQYLHQRTSEILPPKAVKRTDPTPKQTAEGIVGSLLRGFSDIVLQSVGLGKGYCIGCNTKIDYDEFRPYCPECYKQWVVNKKRNATFCHSCGERFGTSINKPVCLSCWKKTLQYR